MRLDGPFADGIRGTTKPAGAAPTQWLLSEIQKGRGAVIEVEAPGAVLRFSWSFEDSARGGTHITQQVTLEGERAADYLGAMKEFEAGIPAGLRSLARALAANSAAQG